MLRFDARRAAAAVLVGAFASCNPFPDLSELRGGAGADGGGQSLDGSIADGGVGDAARFCVPDAHAFCSDFDDGKSLPAPWDDETTADGQFQLTSDGTARSLPHAAQGKLPVVQDNVKHDITLKKTIDHAWARAVLEFDLFIQQPNWTLVPSAGPFFLGHVDFATAADPNQFFIWMLKGDDWGSPRRRPTTRRRADSSSRVTASGRTCASRSNPETPAPAPRRTTSRSAIRPRT